MKETEAGKCAISLAEYGMTTSATSVALVCRTRRKRDSYLLSVKQEE